MAAPVNTVLPVISGTVAVGEELSVDNGTWTGSVASYSYQWQRVNSNTEDISGATSNSYTVIADDTDHQLQCVVTATSNQDESASVTTLPTITVLGDWFIVEDGTAKTDAISLCSVEDANDYHAKRGNTNWTFLSSANKKELLTKATDYLTQVYRLRLKGSRVSADQSLDWPRNYVTRDDFIASQLNGYQMIGGVYYYPNNIVPKEVIYACAEMAWKANSGDLAPDLTRRTTREKIDTLEVEYSDYGIEYVRYRAIDNLLAPFIDEGMSGAVRKVVR